MTSPMQYTLLTDNCDTCQFLKSTLLLLGHSHNSFYLDDYLDTEGQTLSGIILTCKNGLAALPSSIDGTLIVSGDTAPEATDIPFNFLEHPYELETFKKTLSQTEKNHDVEQSILSSLVGNNPVMLKIKDTIRHVADCTTNVLILGESGTGKDVIASCIHKLSSRRDKPFVPINCGAIPSELMESELFGHEKGAFTGAYGKRPGRFEIANHGTLFLDEIGDMPLHMQVKLLRAIQEKQIERVGSSNPIEVDVRIIAATNQNLETRMKEKKFREDLYYRLNVIPIHVPSLRERSDDIPMLIEYLLTKIAKRIPTNVEFDDEALELVCHYKWPGNIRELANFLERIAVLHRENTVSADALKQLYPKMIVSKPASLIPSLQLSDDFKMKEYISEVERKIIKMALEKSNGIVSTAAQYLSIGRTTLIEKIKKYKLTSD